MKKVTISNLFLAIVLLNSSYHQNRSTDKNMDIPDRTGATSGGGFHDLVDSEESDGAEVDMDDLSDEGSGGTNRGIDTARYGRSPKP